MNEREKVKTYNTADFTALSTQSRVLALLVEFVDGLGASGDFEKRKLLASESSFDLTTR